MHSYQYFLEFHLYDHTPPFFYGKKATNIAGMKKLSCIPLLNTGGLTCLCGHICFVQVRYFERVIRYQSIVCLKLNHQPQSTPIFYSNTIKYIVMNHTDSTNGKNKKLGMM